MILYSKDPELSLKVITTVQGKKEYRRNCKFINNKFYLMNEDCFLVDNQWYRKESGKIEYDNEIKTWVLKSKVYLADGIIGFKNGALVRGFFSLNPYTNCKVGTPDLGTMLCQNSDFLLENGYFEDLGTCKWWLKKSVTPEQFKKMTTIRNEVNHHVKGYNIEDNAKEFEEKKQNYAQYPTKISKEVRKYAKFLGNLTFGFEVETDQGNMPDSIQNKNGIVICRDGSIHSAEYVSVPLQGPKGLQTIINFAGELSKRTTINMECSLHYHIGSIPTDRLHLITLYVLGYKVQDDVFKMFPYYKTDHRGVKKKNYCQKLKKMQIHSLKDFSKEGYKSYIDEVYVRLFTFLSDGHPPSSGNNTKIQSHPIRNKFDRPSRYYWNNLQNMIFSARRTTEYRIHTPTTNPVKMTVWLFMCVALTKYAELNSQEILAETKKISFEDVLNYYRDAFPGDKDAEFLSEYLISYYQSQSAVFAADLEKNDKLSSHDIDSDKDFTFSYQNKTLF